MAIEIKPKKEKKVKLSSSFNALFYFSIIIFLLSLSSYVFVSQWNREVKARLDEKEQLLENLRAESDFQENRDFIEDYRTKMNNFQNLFWGRNSFSTFFKTLEEAIHPLVFFEVIDIDAVSRELRIDGRAYNLEALEQQYNILKNLKVEREFIGWVREMQVEEKEEDTLLLRLDQVPVYKNPVSQDEIGIIDADKFGGKENVEINYFQKITPEDYELQSVDRDSTDNFLAHGWYEVLAIEEIAPFEEVELVEMGRMDGDFEVDFEFNIKVDSVIFKP